LQQRQKARQAAAATGAATCRWLVVFLRAAQLVVVALALALASAARWLVRLDRGEEEGGGCKTLPSL
jgi:hypothetical protein